MTRDHLRIATDYARRVVAGEELACKWVTLACRRFLRDLERQGTDGFPFELPDSPSARWRAQVQLIETLPHVKGEWARRGERLTLQPFQVFQVVNVLGWRHRKTKLRRFRWAYCEEPRKNGKTMTLAAVILAMLIADGEAGCEAYSAATTRDQARMVWDTARQMALRSPELCREFGLQVGAHALSVARTASTCRPLSAEAHTLEGLNIHFAAIDELHAHPTREVVDVIETATGSRSQPLVWAITTAGSNRSGICYEKRGYVTRVLEGTVEDETVFGIIYTLDDGDDWRDRSLWVKANPNLGHSVYVDDLERKARAAEQTPAAVNAFLTKHLNVWVNADHAWMNMQAWQRAADSMLSIEDFADETCWLGIDLATRTDIAPVVAVFRRELEGAAHYYAFGRYYLPEETVEGSANSQYSGWVRAGRMETTPGATLDFGAIEDAVRDLGSRHAIVEAAYDPWQAAQLAGRLEGEGFPMVELRPTVANFSEPMKSLEALVLSGRFHFDGDPVLTWMVSNVVCHRDAKDNVYPRKERPDAKIDGVVALLMALSRAMIGGGKPRTYTSIYSDPAWDEAEAQH